MDALACGINLICTLACVKGPPAVVIRWTDFRLCGLRFKCEKDSFRCGRILRKKEAGTTSQDDVEQKYIYNR